MKYLKPHEKLPIKQIEKEILSHSRVEKCRIKRTRTKTERGDYVYEIFFVDNLGREYKDFTDRTILSWRMGECYRCFAQIWKMDFMENRKKDNF